jgi:hypothetical protein
MENINLSLDSRHFPQIAMRYSQDRMKELLVKMCLGLKIEVNEDNLYSMAAHVERDLRRLFA